MRALALIVLFVPVAAFGERPLPHMRAVRVAESPKLDGKLDDPAWQTAPVVDTFVQKFPKEGTKPSEQTMVRVIYDRDAIWVGVDCPQRKAEIIGPAPRNCCGKR